MSCQKCEHLAIILLHSCTQGACVQRASYLVDAFSPLSKGRCGMLWFILRFFYCKIKISTYESSHLLTHRSASQKTKHNSSVSLPSFLKTEVKTTRPVSLPGVELEMELFQDLPSEESKNLFLML